MLSVNKTWTQSGKEKTLLRATKMDWIHNLIHLDGQKFDFSGREYLRPIYNGGYQHILLKTGRQVEKSTALANNIIIESVIRPYFKTVYVSPSHSQTRQFSSDKLKPWIEKSPLIRRYFQNSGVSQQVFEKGFTNGSMVFLRSAFLTADRCRGLSAHLLCLDEIQDILISNVPVIAECLSHSPHALKVYSGTPKTLENTIEQYWSGSSMCEWMVPCERHTPRVWNFLDERNIGKHGPVCCKCKK